MFGLCGGCVTWLLCLFGWIFVGVLWLCLFSCALYCVVCAFGLMFCVWLVVCGLFGFGAGGIVLLMVVFNLFVGVLSSAD